MQQAKPDYAEASQAFAQALADQKLEIRDESLINLGWCQFMQARATEADPAAQKKLYQQSRETLTDYVKSYPQGSSVDQALFFSGEIEYSLGNSKQAIDLYEQLIKNKTLASSTWKADAQYALGVAYEQMKQDGQAKGIYETFLSDNREHRLRNKVALRLADILLRTGAPAEAEKLLQQAAAADDRWQTMPCCDLVNRWQSKGSSLKPRRCSSKWWRSFRNRNMQVQPSCRLVKCIFDPANTPKPPNCLQQCWRVKAIKGPRPLIS